MSAVLLDGKALAARLLASLRTEVEALRIQAGRGPRLMNITVGEDASAGSYARSQVRAAEAAGVDYQFIRLPREISRQEVVDQINCLNRDPAVDGILIHKPLPGGIEFQDIADRIDPDRDIEGVGARNMGRLLLGIGGVLPCTAAAAVELALSAGVDLAGKEAVVVGRSEIVGKPAALLLLGRNATVTVCHSGTSRAGRLEEAVRRAEVLLTAMGRPAYIRGEWIRKGAIVVDAGINVLDGHIVGDVEFSLAAERAAFITPVPGGVGPVTAAMLMKNGVAAFRQRMGAA